MTEGIVISLEGVNISRGYIVREMTIYFLATQETRHYFFTAPSLRLTEEDRRTESYSRRRLGGLGLQTPLPGALDFTQSTKIVTRWGHLKYVL